MRDRNTLEASQAEAIRQDLENPRYEDGHRVWSGTALGLHRPLNPARTDMAIALMDMARHCYGYGRWDAPYWFIGPEQGMSSNEEIVRRVSAWNQDCLDDCRDFHNRIGEYRWHEKPVKLQKTWKQLILLLLAFKGQPLDLRKPDDKAVLCNYQSMCWGMRNGECVIELSGLPANSYASSKKQKSELFQRGEFESIRDERIEFIKIKMLEQIRNQELKLVVMYGLKEKKHFEKIAQVAEELSLGNRSIIEIATHPVSFEGVKKRILDKAGVGIAQWKDPPPLMRAGI